MTPQPVTIQCPSDLLEVLKTAADKAEHTVQAEILKRLAKSARVKVAIRRRGRQPGATFPNGYGKN